MDDYARNLKTRNTNLYRGQTFNFANLHPYVYPTPTEWKERLTASIMPVQSLLSSRVYEKNSSNFITEPSAYFSQPIQANGTYNPKISLSKLYKLYQESSPYHCSSDSYIAEKKFEEEFEEDTISSGYGALSSSLLSRRISNAGHCLMDPLEMKFAKLPALQNQAHHVLYSTRFSFGQSSFCKPIAAEDAGAAAFSQLCRSHYPFSTKEPLAISKINNAANQVRLAVKRKTSDAKSIENHRECNVHKKDENHHPGKFKDGLAAQLIEKDNVIQFLFNIPKNEIIQKNEYKVLKEISKGSFGVVYAACWHGKCVAVKRAHGKMTLEAMRSVAREINAYRKLGHPQIVKYYGVCLDPTCLSIITEYIPNGNLFDALFYGKVRFSSKVRIKLALQLAQVAHYLHEQKNLVHRDLKTANLILDENDDLKLCDFGKTRELDSKRKVRLEENGGSPRYMAPECFVSGNSINEKADIWSLGCCLIEIFGGPIPFEDIRTNQEVVHELLTNKRMPSAPVWFHPIARAIVNRCLRWHFEQRATASQVIAEIQKLTSEDLDMYGMNRKRVA